MLTKHKGRFLRGAPFCATRSQHSGFRKGIVVIEPSTNPTARTEAELRALMARAVHEVRETNPLAPSITNTVTQNFVANAQLAVGGSAAMVYLPDEGECVAALGGAIYINLGTLLPVYEQTVPATARACAGAGKPWVLDPVGIGIGSLRTQLIEAVRENPPAILRGNASEIIAVAELWGLGNDTAEDASGDGPAEWTVPTLWTPPSAPPWRAPASREGPWPSPALPTLSPTAPRWRAFPADRPS